MFIVNDGNGNREAVPSKPVVQPKPVEPTKQEPKQAPKEGS
jgi:hypothetical protein